MAQEKRIYYICVARGRSILADYTKSGSAKDRVNFESFTAGILPRVGKGTLVLPYQE